VSESSGMPNEGQAPLFVVSTKREGAPAFLIGITTSSDPLHAVKDRHATSPRECVPTVCGAVATIAREWGEFVRGNEKIDSRAPCPQCAWFVALEHGTAEGELSRRRLTSVEIAALQRSLRDPLIHIRTWRRLLELGREDEPGDTDRAWLAYLLGLVTAHKPVLLLAEPCLEGDCDHDSEDECYGEDPAVACMACSVLTGSWAGEWEGQVHVQVSAPCSVLTAIATHYEKAVAS
jgi:hypothetical protein